MDRDQFEQEMARSMLLSDLPDELKSFVRSQAWEQGHSSGYAEVLGIARGILYDLGMAFDKYLNRIGR